MRATKKNIQVTLDLTPEQVREAYRQLIKQEHEDWFYEPEAAEELLARAVAARNELRRGKTVPWSRIRGSLAK